MSDISRAIREILRQKSKEGRDWNLRFGENVRVDERELYAADASVPTLSVNAGDYKLYVGGMGINAAFLQYTTPLEKRTKGSSRNYFQDADIQNMHQRCLDGYRVREQGTDKLKCVYASKSPAHIYDERIGAVFVDLFKDDHWPHGNEKNVGMVYAVGPRGYNSGGHGPLIDSADEFLDIVRDTAERILRASDIAMNQKGAWVLNMTLLSANAYRHKACGVIDVVRAILDGLNFAYGSIRDSMPIISFREGDPCSERASVDLRAPAGLFMTALQAMFQTSKRYTIKLNDHPFEADDDERYEIYTRNKGRPAKMILIFTNKAQRTKHINFSGHGYYFDNVLLPAMVRIGYRKLSGYRFVVVTVTELGSASTADNASPTSPRLTTSSSPRMKPGSGTKSPDYWSLLDELTS
jgi:hypothetical protein